MNTRNITNPVYVNGDEWLVEDYDSMSMNGAYGVVFNTKTHKYYGAIINFGNDWEYDIKVFPNKVFSTLVNALSFLD